jgi:hypothetical protein
MAAADENLVVELVSSGGFQGMHRGITVADNGKFTVRDRRKHSVSERVLVPVDIEEIKQLVQRLPDTHPGRAQSCPDCIQYQITFMRGHRPNTVVLTTPLPAKSPYRPLLEKLIKLVENTTQ